MVDAKFMRGVARIALAITAAGALIGAAAQEPATDIVIRGGMNISSEEIENLLMSHADVRDAAVIGLPDAIMGERVCAVVVQQPNATLTLPRLIEHLRNVKEVAAYKWPESLILVEELPRNPVGKVLKRELRDRYAQAVLKDSATEESTH